MMIMIMMMMTNSEFSYLSCRLNVHRRHNFRVGPPFREAIYLTL